jgi:hypothetical protein
MFIAAQPMTGNFELHMVAKGLNCERIETMCEGYECPI